MGFKSYFYSKAGQKNTIQSISLKSDTERFPTFLFSEKDRMINNDKMKKFVFSIIIKYRFLALSRSPSLGSLSDNHSVHNRSSSNLRLEKKGKYIHTYKFV